MQQIQDLLTDHGNEVVFAWAFVVQGGAPLPAVPMLVGAACSLA
jgi:hypothetical protein